MIPKISLWWGSDCRNIINIQYICKRIFHLVFTKIINGNNIRKTSFGRSYCSNGIKTPLDELKVYFKLLLLLFYCFLFLAFIVG